MVVGLIVYWQQVDLFYRNTTGVVLNNATSARSSPLLGDNCLAKTFWPPFVPRCVIYN